MVTAVRTPASTRKDQWMQPRAMASEETNPVSPPTNTRPPATVGSPYAELPNGNPNAHFSASFGVSAAVRPGIGLNRELLVSNPHPFHDGPFDASNGWLASHRFFTCAASPVAAEPSGRPPT